MDGVDALEVLEGTDDEVEEEKEEPASVFLEVMAADDDDLLPSNEVAETTSLIEARLRRDPVEMETLFSISIEGDEDGSTKDAVVWSWCAARFSAKRFSRFRPSIRRRSSSAIRVFISVTLAWYTQSASRIS